MAVTNQQLHDRLKDIIEALSLIADQPKAIVVPSGIGPNFSQVTAAIENQTTTLSSNHSAEMATLGLLVDGLEAQLATLLLQTDGLESELAEVKVNTDQASGSGESIAQLLEKFQDKRVNDWLGQMDGRLDTINT
ncbi:unnamed protein product, partial [marine sediment metagenome]